jgi:hypothetical protein
LTLVEALKKNKPLRRPIPKHMGRAEVGYLEPEYVYNLLIVGQIRNTRPVIINKEDILADDWEVKDG